MLLALVIGINPDAIAEALPARHELICTPADESRLIKKQPIGRHIPTG